MHAGDPSSDCPSSWAGGKEVWVRSKARPVSGPENGKEVEGIFPGVTRHDAPGVIDIAFAGGFTASPEPEDVFWSGSEALAAGSTSGLRVRCIFSLCRTDGWGRWEEDGAPIRGTYDEVARRCRDENTTRAKGKKLKVLPSDAIASEPPQKGSKLHHLGSPPVTKPGRDPGFTGRDSPAAGGVPDVEKDVTGRDSGVEKDATVCIRFFRKETDEEACVEIARRARLKRRQKEGGGEGGVHSNP
ncbi:hypothetical protein T484DRAFT_1768233 [Baffinella frigidus]|nr:hypothetical protein T484DRAFT_1768233 [Cryptophyta sp. CCMP2293]